MSIACRCSKTRSWTTRSLGVGTCSPYAALPRLGPASRRKVVRAGPRRSRTGETRTLSFELIGFGWIARCGAMLRRGAVALSGASAVHMLECALAENVARYLATVEAPEALDEGSVARALALPVELVADVLGHKWAKTKARELDRDASRASAIASARP